jgi:hypothetical protein
MVQVGRRQLLIETGALLAAPLAAVCETVRAGIEPGGRRAMKRRADRVIE